MFLNLFPRPFWAPDDTLAGGGGDDTLADGGDDTAPGSGGDDTLSGDGDDTLAGGGGKWWEGDAYSSEDREYLTARGLTLDDPAEVLPKVVQAHRNAEKRLGAPADSLMSKPEKGGDVGEWLRNNGDVFDVPKNADGYKIEPKDLGEGVAWDEAFEKTVRDIGHKHGASQGLIADLVDAYAERAKGFVEDAGTKQSDAEGAMMQTLQSDWGDQTKARIAMAQQAFQAVATEAGLDEAATTNAAQVLSEKTGDAAVMRMFEAMSKLMSEDSMGDLPGGGGGLGQTPAEARAELHALRQPGGEFFEASKANNKAKIKELQPKMARLTKLAAQ